MTVLNETNHAGEFMVSEANGTRSRDAGVLASGEDLVAGTVVGKVAASGKFAQHDPSASDGSESASAILFAGVDASTADAPCVVIARDAEVNGGEIVWPDGIAAQDKTDGIAFLATVGIKVL